LSWSPSSTQVRKPGVTCGSVMGYAYYEWHNGIRDRNRSAYATSERVDANRLVRSWFWACASTLL
jgi:hypothetical protein